MKWPLAVPKKTWYYNCCMANATKFKPIPTKFKITIQVQLAFSTFTVPVRYCILAQFCKTYCWQYNSILISKKGLFKMRLPGFGAALFPYSTENWINMCSGG
jgi:hypothetical protein